MEFSWDFRGSESLRPKHFLTLGPFSWVFRGIFVDPLKTKLVAFSWSFRGFFVGVGTPPATETCASPLPRKALKRIFLGAKCLPHNQVLMQEDSGH